MYYESKQAVLCQKVMLIYIVLGSGKAHYAGSARTGEWSVDGLLCCATWRSYFFQLSCLCWGKNSSLINHAPPVTGQHICQYSVNEKPTFKDHKLTIRLHLLINSCNRNGIVQSAGQRIQSLRVGCITCASSCRQNTRSVHHLYWCSHQAGDLKRTQK